jgi:uncharacterized membrane protein
MIVRLIAATLLGILLAFAGSVVYTRAITPAQGKLEAGATAYGWLASPAGDATKENRAAVLERLIQRELEK